MTSPSHKVKFKVNGMDCEVGCEVTSKMTLVDYIRKVLNLPGTKYMCREGGCGACVVSVTRCPGDIEQAVNSCLVSITSCQDWEITTIEALGNRHKGYHTLQKTLAENNGTQCGYCTPGWIMAMHSLLQRKKRPTMREIEHSFGSNVCRCTGYRPILKAFKNFACDAPKNVDIEDINKCKTDCEKDWCFVNRTNRIKIVLKDGRVWYRVDEIDDIFDLFEKDDSYMLVAGNTGKGAYPIDEYPRVLIDISCIEQLKCCKIGQNLTIGGGSTLTEVLDLFQKMSKEENFSYLNGFWKHLKKVAHVAVRNLATIAGNLMLKHQHRDFASDVFLLLECVGAQLTLCSKSHGTNVIKQVTMQEFLQTDMRKKIIVNILLPPLSQEFKIVTFKIMPRSQSSHAIVNAAYMYKLTDCNTVKECRIVYGGLSSQFVRAKDTERCLIGKNLFSNNTLKKALEVLDCELVVDTNPFNSVEYRRHLALALFYKGLLKLHPKNNLHEEYRSGAVKIHDTRPVSKGTQVYKTDPSLWPLNQPLQKVEALIQCSGEASYTEDLPYVPYEMSAAFVLTTVPTGDIVHIDASKALKYKGVLAFYAAKDIPGLNSFTPVDDPFGMSDEEVFCNSKVRYHSQPIGIIVAETQEIAASATKLVEVTYKNVKKPILTIEEAKTDPSRIFFYKAVDATKRGSDVVKVIKSSNCTYGQYHFAMENISCLVQPSEEGLKVHATAHWLDATQLMISRALDINQNRIDVHMRRLGGSYGLKITRSIQSSVACSLAAYLLNRPCRLIVPMQVATKAVGKRLPCYTEFEVGVDASGKIQYMKYDFYEDNGYLINELFVNKVMDGYNSCYDKTTWDFRCFNAITDTHKNSWCRGPGNLEAVAMAEFIMEQIACELKLDPLDVRLANISEEHAEIKQMIESVKNNSNYYQRRLCVDKFNSENRWVKRGLRCSLMRWSPAPVGQLQVTLSVYHGDGTVALTHSGIEMGQGLNTKAIQICAYLLNIPVHKIIVKENNTVIGCNAYATAGSLGGQNVALGVTQCCEELLERLKPMKDRLVNPTWEELIKTAFENNINLQTHGFVAAVVEIFDYNVYGVAVSEVEIDVLTGEFEVVRVDVEQDVGCSTSPLIDVGQVEGAFTMGQGYWTCEELVYDKNTGEMLTDRTWNYYVPLAIDIPQDFRVYFREKSYSFKEIFGAKAIGEPPICLSVVIALAIREALTSARHDSGIPTTKWFPIKGPYTVEKIALAAETKMKDFKF